MSPEDEIQWISSQKDIGKQVLIKGEFGEKPLDNSVCTIKISDIIVENDTYESAFVKLNKTDVDQQLIIGECDTPLDRKLQRCLETMSKDETSLVTITLSNNIFVKFKLHLKEFEFKGYIFELLADKKYELAKHHKDIGVELFKQNRPIDAFYRFSKAIKLLISCALEVDDDSEEIEGVQVADIEALKSVLYGNLASCHLKVNNYEDVIVLATKALVNDPDNKKTIYKRAMAYAAVRDFEKAQSDLVLFLEQEPNHTVAREKLVYVREELVKSHHKFANMCEKMFK